MQMYFFCIQMKTLLNRDEKYIIEFEIILQYKQYRIQM